MKNSKYTFLKSMVINIIMLSCIAVVYNCTNIPTAPQLNDNVHISAIALKNRTIALQITGINTTLFDSVTIMYSQKSKISIKNTSAVPFHKLKAVDTIIDTIRNLNEKSMYYLLLSFQDKSGLSSEDVLISNVTTLDETPPSKIPFLQASVDSLFNGSRNLYVRWKSPDDSDILHINVICSTATGSCFSYNVIPSDTSFLFYSISADQQYTVSVIAVDSSGNRLANDFIAKDTVLSIRKLPEKIRNFHCRINSTADSLYLFWQTNPKTDIDSIGFTIDTTGRCPDTLDKARALYASYSQGELRTKLPAHKPCSLGISAFSIDTTKLISEPSKTSLFLRIDSILNTIIKVTTIHDTIHDTIIIPTIFHDTIHDTIYIPKIVHDTTIETLIVHVPVHDTSYITIVKKDTIQKIIHDTTIMYDTIIDIIVKYQVVTSWDTVNISKTDTIVKTINDTLYLRDTIRVPVIITVRDTVPPFNVTNPGAVLSGASSVIVHWSPSLSADVSAVMIGYKADGSVCSSPMDPDGLYILTSKQEAADTIMHLQQKRTYTFSFFVQDSSGNWNRPENIARVTIMIPDKTSPENVSTLTASWTQGECSLSWTPPKSPDSDSIILRYSTDGTFPQTVTEGLLLSKLPASAVTYTFSGLRDSVQYRFSAFVKDSAGLWSLSTPASQCILNRIPIAHAGSDLTGSIVNGSTFQLDAGLSSDPDGQVLTYTWTGADNNPSGIIIPSTVRPSIQLTVPGRYVFILTVSDGTLNSKPDQCILTYVVPQIIVSPTLPSGQGYIVCRNIQEGIDSASAGDTIFVVSGLYNENIDIRKNGITLMGADTNVIVDGRNLGACVAFAGGRNCLIQNFKFLHGGRTDIQQIDVGGITCSTATSIVIDKCIFSNCNGDGIRLWVSNGITIQNSTITQNDWNGIRVTSSSFTIKNTHFLANSRRDLNAATSNISLEMRQGEITRYPVVVDNNRFVMNQGGHHIGIFGPYSISITGNSFVTDSSQYAVGEAIYSGTNTKSKISMADNKFQNFTSVASVFLIDVENITATRDSLLCRINGTTAKGYDFVNCAQGTPGSGSTLQNIYIEGFATGAAFYNSPLAVQNAHLRRCNRGILLTGLSSSTPVLTGTTFTECTVNIDSSGVQP